MTMNIAMITPVAMTAMNPNNYLGRKDDRKKAATAKKKPGGADKRADAEAVLYEPTDPETALREFYAAYGK